MKRLLVACVTAALLSLQTVLMAEDSGNDDKILAEEIKERAEVIREEAEEEFRTWRKKMGSKQMDRAEICARIYLNCVLMCRFTTYGKDMGLFGSGDRLGPGANGGAPAARTPEQEHQLQCTLMCYQQYGRCMRGDPFVGPSW